MALISLTTLSRAQTNTSPKALDLADAEYKMLLRMNLQKGKYSYSLAQDPSSPASREIKQGAIDQDHVLRLNFLAHPLEPVKGRFQIEVIAGDPYLRDKDIWQNDTGDILNPRVGAYLTRADFTFLTRFMDVRIYKWAEHQASGDLLDLYPAQWDLEQSRRWGNFLPEGFELTGKETLQNLFLAGGQVPSYHSMGKPNSSVLFGRYIVEASPLSLMFLYKHKLVEDYYIRSSTNHFIPPSYPAYQLKVNDRVPALDMTLDVSRIIQGVGMLLEGELAGNFPVRESMVPAEERKDVYYSGAAKVKYDIFPEYMALTGRYDYADIYAGNVTRWNGGVEIKPFYYLKLGVEGTEQAPLRDPAGTNFTSAPLVVQDNRQAEIIKVSLTYDPTPLTGFNQKNANLLEDAPLAFQLSYVNGYYPTWTDIPVKIDYILNRYEIYRDGVFGLYPVETHKLVLKIISSYWYPFQIIAYSEGGKKQAEYSSSVAPSPWTLYYNVYLELMKMKRYSVSFYYARSDWEFPVVSDDLEFYYDRKLENFHKELGLPVDHRWMAGLKRYFGNSSIELRYELQIIDFSSEGYRDAWAYSRSGLGVNYKKLQRTHQITAAFDLRF
ncbi:MAG: hypothetical protein PHF84_05230 [bacterium]|nr:hypothetical protein [bacterium]